MNYRFAIRVKEITDDRVLILPDEEENVTPGGIMLPDTAKDRPRTGVVVAVGPGKLCDSPPSDTIVYGAASDGVQYVNCRHRMQVKVGDYVCFTVYNMQEIEVDGFPRKLRYMREPEILFIIEKPEPKA